jgi:hypothetical protein
MFIISLIIFSMIFILMKMIYKNNIHNHYFYIS